MNQSQTDIKVYGLKIFNAKWKLTIRHKYNIKLSEVEIFGVPTVGDVDYDREIMEGMDTVYLSINDMVEFHKQSIPFRIVNYADTTTIYNITNKYLEAWADQLNNGINVGNAPIQDLVAIDRFTQELYKFSTVNQDRRSDTAHAWFGTSDNKSNTRNNIGGIIPVSEIGERTAIEELFASAMTRRGINRGS